MQIFELDSIGTHLRIQLDTDTSCDALFVEITSRLTKFEKKFSRFIEGNWLDNLNRERKGTLDIDGFDMLRVALDVARKTDGYFDPTIAGALSTLGYGREEHRGHTVGYQNVIVDGITVTLLSDVILEFGGVGKGYLIDILQKMIQVYFEKLGGTIPRFLIDFGGDLFAHGKDWKIGLESSYNQDEVIGTLELDDFYLACSAGSKRKWGNHHHLINPKSGESAREVLAVFIEGSSGIITDSYATALSVMPFLKACEILSQGNILEGIILSSDGKVFQSPRSRSTLFTA